MRSKNSNSSIGHIGTKPELKYTPNGTPYARFSIACNFSFKKDGDWVTDVDWLPFVAYGKTAQNIVKHLDKGSHVSIESRLKPWSNGKEGDARRSGINLVVTDILFLDSKNESASPEQVAEVPSGAEVTDEDIPF